ncbi:MAG: glycosyltransferase family 39 protein [Candidatus Yanofskybacteria bacterium]|nr:glycosyltransferase family 39 protein [Candidatus Yanofskybacteria bacterium]
MPKWTIILLIIVIAAVFRLQGLGSTPPGLYPDEAMNGNNATQALETNDFKIFYPENNGREGLFINLQALSIAVFGEHNWALRLVSAIIGILTILGLYLLAKQLFNWQIAALSSYLMAIAFWHVNFSRIGFRAILAPMLLVWGFYFLLRGLSSTKFWNFAISGIFWGLGFYTYIAFRAMPLALILVLLAYWQTVKKDYEHKKYLHARNQIVRGLALFLIVVIVVALPIGYYFWTHPADFLGRTGQLSIFASENPLQALAKNTFQTLGMFNFIGDWNWRHNLSGQPLLLWPVGVLFVIGFLRSWLKLFKRAKTHGHLSSAQVLLLSWFFVGLIPTVISNEGLPHALRALIVAPVVFIWAGEGLWWIMDKLGDWYRARDIHEFHIRHLWLRESSFAAVLAVIVLLTSLTIAEYDKYFNKWARNSNTADAFAQNYVDIGERLNAMPQNVKKYVLVNAGGVLVNDIPMPAQTVMYLTDTYTPEKQQAKNLFYLTEAQYEAGQYDRNSVVIPLEK